MSNEHTFKNGQYLTDEATSWLVGHLLALKHVRPKRVRLPQSAFLVPVRALYWAGPRSTVLIESFENPFSGPHAFPYPGWQP